MKVKIFLISLIVILLAGIGVFVGLEWDDVIVPLFTGEEIYTKKDISDIEKKYENALDNSINRQLEEIEKEKSRANEYESKFKEQQRENERLYENYNAQQRQNEELLENYNTQQRQYEQLLEMYNELQSNPPETTDQLTQEMFNLLINYGSVYHISDNEVFISGYKEGNDQELIYYNTLTKECHKIDGIGVVNDWFRNENMFYGLSRSNLVRVNIDTFEGKVLKQDFSMRYAYEVLYGTNSAGKECLLFYGFGTRGQELVELELETENVQTFDEELLNVDDKTLEFHLLWKPNNQFLENSSDVYRYNLGKFEKCFTLGSLANLHIVNGYINEMNLEEYLFNNVLVAYDNRNYMQFINLENFKTLELTIDQSEKCRFFNCQYTRDVIYFGAVNGKFYKINVPEMTSEELGTTKDTTSVSKYDQMFGELFFVQNNDLSYSLKLARYGSEELENIKDFTSDVEFKSLETSYNSVRIKVQESGQEKVYVYNCITEEISEEN